MYGYKLVWEGLEEFLENHPQMVFLSQFVCSPHNYPEITESAGNSIVLVTI
jgi:hypothetical protein